VWEAYFNRKNLYSRCLPRCQQPGGKYEFGNRPRCPSRKRQSVTENRVVAMKLESNFGGVV
jgi:hypothetical protein